jgi:hypothetical protein
MLSQVCVRVSKGDRLPRPTGSPVIVLSDFFLFGSIKGRMPVYNCECQYDPLKAIHELFCQIGNGMLINVFESWITRLQWVIKQEGEYYLK